MKRIIIAITVALAYLVILSVVYSHAINLLDRYPDLYWFDLNKEGKDDDKACLVYALSGALASASGKKASESPDSLARLTIERLGNKPLSFLEVVDAFFEVGGHEKPKTTTGWYRRYWSFDSYSGADTENMLNRIVGAMNEGNIVLPLLRNPGDVEYSHVVTAYIVDKSRNGHWFMSYTDSDTGGKYKMERDWLLEKDGKLFMNMSDGSLIEIFGYLKVRILEI